MKPEPYPTSESIEEWDDASLLAATGCVSSIRYHEYGFDALNPTERFLCCFNLLESCVNNGGVGHWIESLCPKSATATPPALVMIGSEVMADFTRYALRPMQNTSSVSTKDAWVEQYHSLPDHVHEHWETLSRRYCELEGKFLASAYLYTRSSWQLVRVV